MSDRDDLFATTNDDLTTPAVSMSRDDLFSSPDSVQNIPDQPSYTPREGYVQKVDSKGNVYYAKPGASTEYEKAGSHFDPLTGILGAGDITLAAAHGAAMAPISGAADLAQLATGDTSGSWRDTVGRFTYHPQTTAGQALFQGLSQTLPADIGRGVANVAGQAVNALPASVQPVVRMGGRVLGDAAKIAPVLAMRGIPAVSGETAIDQSVTPSVAEANNLQERLAPGYAGQSMGAAASAPNLLNATPALRAKVETALDEGGGALSDEGKVALGRHAEAESLPIPAQLTRGQALGDEAIRSEEFNNKAKFPEIGQRFQEQNQNLIDNLQALREKAGPEVFSTDAPGHGDTLINAYKTKDAAVQADIKAKYEALKAANGGEFPVDGKTFAKNAQIALKQNMKAPFLPAPVQNIMDSYLDTVKKDGTVVPGEQMTYENFENLRTTLAAEARKAERAGDGNAGMAVSLVRNELEALPMSGESVQIKMLADQARQAAKARFDALRADPAYNAAVNDSVAPDNFVKKFVIGGTRDNVATMRSNLAHDPVAQQTMSVAALDHLRDQSGAVNGQFSQAGYNKALRGIAPKIGSLVDPDTAEQLDRLGTVAKWQQQQGRGGYYNNSGTFVAAAKEYAAHTAEGIANVKAGGVPVGTAVRNLFKGRANKAYLQQTLEPGAGITAATP